MAQASSFDLIIDPVTTSHLNLTDKATLNLGCGQKKLPHAVNVDITGATAPDLVHDLDQFPWPLPDNHFTEVIMSDVLEHLDDLVAVLEEIHRVSAPDALLRITVPHFSSANAFTDPTHRHYFGWSTMDYFTGEHQHSYYTDARFHIQKRALIFVPSLLNKVVWRLANRYPDRYERRWAWIFPAWFLHFELRVIKVAPGHSGLSG
jgi:SAM-dependent methyltransferase